MKGKDMGTIPNQHDKTETIIRTVRYITAPQFPLARGWYFGYRFTGFDRRLQIWQERMAERGWHINTDGYYTQQTHWITKRFQEEKDLKVDGKIGPATWYTAWSAPVTPPGRSR